MINWIVSLPLWQMIRYLGVLSYLLIAAGICLGIVYSFPGLKGSRKAKLYKLHIGLNVGGTAIGLLHGIITVIDTYMPYSWTEVLVPFTSASHPVLNGIGTLSAYGLLLLIFTSDIRNTLRKKLWHLIHLLAYPVFVMAFVHGYFLGTDTGMAWMRWMYFLSVAAVIGLTAVRACIRSAPAVNRPTRGKAGAV